MDFMAHQQTSVGGGVNGPIMTPSVEQLKHSQSETDEKLICANSDGSYFTRYKNSLNEWYIYVYDKNGNKLNSYKSDISLYHSGDSGYFTFYNPIIPSLNSALRFSNGSTIYVFTKNGLVQITVTGLDNTTLKKIYVGECIRKNAALNHSDNCIYTFAGGSGNTNCVPLDTNTKLYKINCNTNTAEIYDYNKSIPKCSDGRSWVIGKGNVRNTYIIDGVIYTVVYNWVSGGSSPYYFAVMQYNIASKTFTITNALRYEDKSIDTLYMGGQFGNNATFFHKRDGKLYFYIIIQSNSSAAKLHEYLVNGSSLSLIRQITLDKSSYDFTVIDIINNKIIVNFGKRKLIP